MSDFVAIYGLYDPRNDELRYVGKAVDQCRDCFAKGRKEYDRKYYQLRVKAKRNGNKPLPNNGEDFGQLGLFEGAE